MALGGGHGLASTLRAVRQYAGRVAAVVSVADDGGSSGRLRQIAGIPAPGDLRRCLVAMATPNRRGREAFEYRFGSGDLEGHALGNLIIAGLANVTGDFGRALDLAAGLLGAQGRVLPATRCRWCSRPTWPGPKWSAGQRVRVAGPITAVSMSCRPMPRPREVLEAVSEADQVVIGPGSLFTSVLAACVVPGSGPPWPPGTAAGSTCVTSGRNPRRRPDHHRRSPAGGPRPWRAGRRDGPAPAAGFQGAAGRYRSRSATKLAAGAADSTDGSDRGGPRTALSGH